MSAGIGISRRTKHPELAEKFIRFYVGDTAAKILVDGGRTVPVRRRQAYGEILQSVHPPESSRYWAEPLEAGRIEGLAYTPGRLEVDTIVRKRFEQALAEPDLPTERIVAGLAADLRAWLAKMQESGLL
jgi:ABC-type Fe3+ transport system substrate-binding protein